MSFTGYSVTQEQVPQHLRANRSTLTRWFGRTILNVFGWQVVGSIPDIKRVLIIVAPHTSNWDFVFAMAAVLGLNLRVRWLGKHTIFKPGAVWFMRWLGGIPTNREQPEDIVQYVANLSNSEEGVAIGLAPEGTRKKSHAVEDRVFENCKITGLPNPFDYSRLSRQKFCYRRPVPAYWRQ